MNKDIFLTNNLSNKKEKFVPLNEKKIGMYVCGPTVYDNPHIGNARPLVILDNVFKYFKVSLSEFDNEHGFANSRARLRMATRYQVAAANKGIVVGTGNKVDDFGVGFYT